MIKQAILLISITILPAVAQADCRMVGTEFVGCSEPDTYVERTEAILDAALQATRDHQDRTYERNVLTTLRSIEEDLSEMAGE